MYLPGKARVAPPSLRGRAEPVKARGLDRLPGRTYPSFTMRRRVVWLSLLVAVLVLGSVALALLPEVVRRVALTKIPQLTGRAAALEDVDLNLFTGRVALKGFRLAQRESSEAALAFERLDVGLSIPALLWGHARVTELVLTAPTIHVARLPGGRFDFSDLLDLIPPADPKQKPSKWVVTLERLKVSSGTLVARDQVPSPASEWRVEGLGIDGAGLTTRADAPPGRLALKTKVNGSPLELSADAVRVAAGSLTARVSIQGFDLTGAAPYVPEGVAVTLRAGRLDVALTANVARGRAGALGGSVTGEVRVAGLTLAQRGRGDSIVTLPQVAVRIKDADVATRTATLAIEADGLTVAATRNREGVIDLLTLVASRPASPDGSPPAASPPLAGGTSPPGAGPTLKLERLDLRGATFVFKDETVTPQATLTVKDLSATVRDFTWPSAGPAAIEAAMTLPGRGRLEVKGKATAVPLEAEFTTSMRDASIGPYASYFPVRARFAGSFSGDSWNWVKVVNGAVTAKSTGTHWIEKLALRDAGGPADAPPLAEVERMTIAGIDFVWPTSARAARITIKRPAVRVERAEDGSINLKKLFATGPTEGSAAPAPSPAPTSDAPAGSRPESSKSAKTLPIKLEIGAVIIEDGFARFLDRTTKPAFSQDIAKLALSLEGFSSTPGQRAKLAVQGLVGGDSALDLRGEIAPFGEFYLDLGGEVRDFALPVANPYADTVTSWIIQRGKLAAKVHYHVEGDRISGDNNVVVGNLQVSPARADDEVKRRIGLPLGLIVALIKDGSGDIHINVPIVGTLSDPKFDLGETIWTAVKNVLVNVLAAPFRAIGRLFTREDKSIEALSVEPVTFAAGAAALEGEMERHLIRVADFLRRAPGVNLMLSGVVTSRDAESLRAQELTARLQKLQRERGLPSYAAAVLAEFRVQFPNVTALPAPEEQIAQLLAREPVPATRVEELNARRVETVREALTRSEGVPADRLRPGEAKVTPEAAGDGRVEFQIAQ